ncbi:3-keto-steroid reductase/17-beta-hydroxysteroid dehydrogenase 7-like [Ruditapes philippinarum]|uniref:3-keto-steroid reductase/17-beta-hydroxysteroid dehydrogenase 7-like n=1 Tax=Ruditapes philippinarum TaxID=129788 RepID=UPI00295AAB0D|nr:3-keto-steroid reductase/17-beta-hydroxysteroid dehydrogenase 7-like [Ruditapes philippinarum]
MGLSWEQDFPGITGDSWDYRTVLGTGLSLDYKTVLRTRHSWDSRAIFFPVLSCLQEIPGIVQSHLTAGVGLSVADRLLSEHECIHVCLACRNKGRAENARTRLMRRHPDSDISIVIVDTSSVESVIRASEEIRNKFTRLDYIYLNAGIMKVSSINWSKIIAIFSSEGVRILSTGWGVLNHINETTPEGLQEIFATNLFGHFVMVRELEDCLGKAQETQIIWTSSQNANSDDFSYTDIQHRNGYSYSMNFISFLNVMF